MASEEASRELRNRGNQAYSECGDSLAPVIRRGRLLKASKLYRQALNASTNEDERAKCCKNLGAVHWKYTKFCFETSEDGRGFDERPLSFDIEASLENYLAALRHGRASRQNIYWMNNIKQNLEDICKHVVEESNWLLSKKEFVGKVGSLFQDEVSSPGAKSQALAIFQLGVAQAIFDDAVQKLRRKDASGTRNYRECLSLLHSCHGPIEEAERNARPDFLEGVNLLKTSVDSCKATCESIQARATGKKLLEESSSVKDRSAQHDKVISALDKFKEAAVLARGVDAECEAEALASVGDVYKEVFKKEHQAHPYYNVAVLLAQNSDAMHSAKWYQQAKVALRHFFKKKKEEANTHPGCDVRPQIRKELEKLTEEYKKKTEDFLRFVYSEHPPRGKHANYRLGELNTVASIRLALRKAIQHYHPDHNAAGDDELWTALCGEITKLLLEKYRMYSNESRT